MIMSKDLKKILDIGISLSSEKNSKKLLSKILNFSMEISNCDAATLYLLKDDNLYFTLMRTKSLNISKGFDDEINLPPVNINAKSVAAIAAKEKRIINIKDVYNDKKYDLEGPKKYDSLTGYHTKSMLVFPLMNKDDDILGVMQLINACDNNSKITSFRKNIVDVIYSLASMTSILLLNDKLYEEINTLLDSFVNAMVSAIDQRTPYNAFHSINVKRLSVNFCYYLNDYNLAKIKENDIEELKMASMLHDIGKIIIPIEVLNKANRFENKIDKMLLRYNLILSEIKNNYLENKIDLNKYNELYNNVIDAKEFIIELNNKTFLTDDDIKKLDIIKEYKFNTAFGEFKIIEDDELDDAYIKKGTLTNEERLIIEKHAYYTHEILKEISFGKKYCHVLDIASNHHEFLNGSGYPNHLTAKDLNILNRIITIMDVYESLTSKDRPYKKPMPKEKAYSILEEMASFGKLDETLVSYMKDFINSKYEIN